jgi:hypothetical protein
MTKLNIEEADFILINIMKLMVLTNDINERTIAENIRDKILDDYDLRIKKCTDKTLSIKHHLEILKDKIK